MRPGTKGAGLHTAERERSCSCCSSPAAVEIAHDVTVFRSVRPDTWPAAGAGEPSQLEKVQLSIATYNDCKSCTVVGPARMNPGRVPSPLYTCVAQGSHRTSALFSPSRTHSNGVRFAVTHIHLVRPPWGVIRLASPADILPRPRVDHRPPSLRSFRGLSLPASLRAGADTETRSSYVSPKRLRLPPGGCRTRGQRRDADAVLPRAVPPPSCLDRTAQATGTFDDVRIASGGVKRDLH